MKGIVKSYIFRSLKTNVAKYRIQVAFGSPYVLCMQDYLCIKFFCFVLFLPLIMNINFLKRHKVFDHPVIYVPFISLMELKHSTLYYKFMSTTLFSLLYKKFLFGHYLHCFCLAFFLSPFLLCYNLCTVKLTHFSTQFCEFW